ncbi:GNAT family N-acetyltransferase [Catellatospora paridis]|uniref:GNAT family N-acetyltransferase n=1 Tax=Catellatospora paridis TaxID=1617086 RepID=UPI0012D4A29D|nr:GNAT family N-acetyltransferase [Catellatospora paridis]
MHLRIQRQHTGSAQSRELRREFVAELARRYPEQDFGADAVTDELPVLDAPGAAWFVVYDGKQPIGCGGLRGLDEHTGEIKWVYLREAARGRNAGRSLLVELEDTARKLGYTRLRLSTGDRQPEALGLYLSAGYRPVDDGVPTPHRLEKDLSPRPDDVYVDVRKYDGCRHWNTTLRRLGTDEHGTWLGGTPHTPWRRGRRAAHFPQAPHVMLVPHEGGWVANFHAPPRRTAVYVDVTLRPSWTGPAHVTIHDLDLDVVRRRDTGAVELLDEYEFAEHQVAYGYPEDVVAEARRTADHLLAAVTAAREPFGSAHMPWLGRLTGAPTGYEDVA